MILVILLLAIAMLLFIGAVAAELVLTLALLRAPNVQAAGTNESQAYRPLPGSSRAEGNGQVRVGLRGEVGIDRGACRRDHRARFAQLNGQVIYLPPARRSPRPPTRRRSAPSISPWPIFTAAAGGLLSPHAVLGTGASPLAVHLAVVRFIALGLVPTFGVLLFFAGEQPVPASAWLLVMIFCRALFEAGLTAREGSTPVSALIRLAPCALPPRRACGLCALLRHPPSGFYFLISHDLMPVMTSAFITIVAIELWAVLAGVLVPPIRLALGFAFPATKIVTPIRS